MKIFYSFFEIRAFITSYDNLKYFGWKSLLVDPNSYFVPLPRKYIPRFFYEELLEKLSKVDDYRNGTAYHSNFSRQVDKFFLTFIIFFNSGRRFSPIRDVEFLSNQYGFYDLLITPLGSFFFIRQKALSREKYLDLIVYSALFPYFFIFSFFFNTFLRAPLFFLLVWLPGIIRTIIPFSKYFIIFLIDTYWWQRFRTLLSAHNARVRYRKPYSRSYFHVPFITLFFIKQHRVTFGNTLLRLKRFIGYRTTNELMLSNKSLYNFYLFRSDKFFVDSYKTALLKKEFENLPFNGNPSNLVYPSSFIKSTIGPRFIRYLRSFFSRQRYSPFRFFYLLRFIKLTSEEPSYDRACYTYRKFWFNSKFIRLEPDGTYFINYLWIFIRNSARILVFYIPSLVLFPLYRFFRLYGSPIVPKFRFSRPTFLNNFKWPKIGLRLNVFKFFLLFLLQFYSLLIFVNYFLRKAFSPIFQYLVSRYHLVYFNSFRRYFIASKFYRFFTREIDEQLEESKPSWDDDFFEEDPSANSLDESEFEATNAEEQVIESREISYEDTDVFGNSFYFDEDDYEKSEYLDPYADDLSDTAIDYDFFEDDENDDEDALFWSLFAFWVDDAIVEIGLTNLDDSLKADEEVFDKSDPKKDPSYEENYYFVYNFILPTENVRPAAVKAAYDYNKYVQGWYNKNKNKTFVHLPDLLQLGGHRDLTSPVSFSDWKKLTVCILPLLSKTFDQKKLNTQQSLKVVWDRLDYEISVNPKTFWNRLNDEFTSQHTIDEIFNEFSQRQRSDFKIFEFFFGQKTAKGLVAVDLYKNIFTLYKTFRDKFFLPEDNSEMFYFCYIATLQANKDFPKFFRLYQSQIANDPKNNWIFDFLVYKAKYDVSDSTVYRIIVPSEEDEADDYLEEAEFFNSKDPLLRYTKGFTYQGILVNFVYDIVSKFTKNERNKRVDFTSPDTSRDNPYVYVMRGGEYTEDTPGSIPTIDPLSPDQNELAGWGFLIPFYTRLIDAFYDPYMNTIYFPSTFTQISDDFVELDEDTEDEIDAYDDYIYIDDSDGYDDAQHTVADVPNSLYNDDPEAEDFLDPDDVLSIGEDGEENTYESAEEETDITFLYDGDFEFYVWENTDNVEEWEYDEFSSYQDLSQPLSRLFFGSLKLDKSFPAVDPRLFIGPLSEHLGDTDLSYKSNFKLIKNNAECKALVPYSTIYSENDIGASLVNKNHTGTNNPRKRFLYRIVATSIRCFRFVSIWVTQIYVEFEFYKSNFSVFSGPSRSISLYLHYKQYAHIYDNTSSKRHTRFIKNWIKDFEAIFQNFESIKKAEKINFFKKSTESKFHFFNDPFGRFWYQQPFVNDIYENGNIDPDSDNELEELYESAVEEIFIDYLDGHSLSNSHLFDLYDKSRFIHLDELEMTNMTGAEEDDHIANTDPMTLSDNELEWDWGTIIGYSSDDDIYHKASEFINVFDIFTAAVSDYIWLIIDYTLYIFRLFGAFHVMGRYHYWSEMADTWWLRAALKYGRWVYFFRYGAAFSFLITICIYSYFVIPRIVYLFLYGVNSYFFTVFAHSFLSFVIFLFSSFFLFRPFYDLYKSMATIEKESLWFYVFIVWFFYIYYGYVSSPWNHFTYDNNVHKIPNLSVEPDNNFYPRSHYQWPHTNKTLESNKQFTIYDTLADRRTLLNRQIDSDRTRLIISYSYSKAPLSIANIYNFFTYYVLGIQNNFIVGYKYIYRIYNTPLSVPIAEMGYDFVHHSYFINFGGLGEKIKPTIVESNWLQYLEYAKTPSLFQYQYHLSDRTFRSSRFRNNHIMSSEQNLAYLDSAIFHPYESRTKELDFQYDSFYPAKFRMHSFSRRYSTELLPNKTSSNIPRNRIKYTRFSSKFRRKTARIKILQYKVYNHGLWKGRRRYLTRAYRQRKSLLSSQTQMIYQLATKDDWFKKEVTKIGSALSFSDNFIFYVYSHYPNLKSPAQELNLARRKSFYAPTGYPSPRVKRFHDRVVGSKYDVYKEHFYNARSRGKKPVRGENIFDEFTRRSPKEWEFRFFEAKFLKNLHKLRYSFYPTKPPRMIITPVDRTWFINKSRKYRQLHHFMNHFMIMNKFYNHNYYARNLIPYLTGNPHHQAYVYSRYLAYESGIRSEKDLNRNVYDAYYDHPIIRKRAQVHFKGLFKSSKKRILGRFPGTYYREISNVRRRQRRKFSPRRIYSYRRKQGKLLARKFIKPGTLHRFQEPFNNISKYGGGIKRRFFRDEKKADRGFLSTYAYYNRYTNPTTVRMKAILKYEREAMKGAGTLNYEWYDPGFPLNESIPYVLSLSCGFIKKNPSYKNGYFTRPVRHSYFQNFLLERTLFAGYKNIYYIVDNAFTPKYYAKRFAIYDKVLNSVFAGNVNVLKSIGLRKPFGSPFLNMKRLKKRRGYSVSRSLVGFIDNNKRMRARYRHLLGRTQSLWRFNLVARARASKIVKRALFRYKYVLEKRIRYLEARARRRNRRKLVTPQRLEQWSVQMDRRAKDPRRNRPKLTGYDVLYYDRAIAKRDRHKKKPRQPSFMSQLAGTRSIVARSMFPHRYAAKIKLDELKGERQIVIERERRRAFDAERRLNKEKKPKNNGNSANLTKANPNSKKSAKTNTWYSWIFGKKSA